MHTRMCIFGNNVLYNFAQLKSQVMYIVILYIIRGNFENTQLFTCLRHNKPKPTCLVKRLTIYISIMYNQLTGLHPHVHNISQKMRHSSRATTASLAWEILLGQQCHPHHCFLYWVLTFIITKLFKKCTCSVTTIIIHLC